MAYSDEYSVPKGARPGAPWLNQHAVVGFDVTADGTTAALCTTNADGTLNITYLGTDTTPAGDLIYPHQSMHVTLSRQDRLTLAAWIAYRDACAEFDRAEDFWGPWIAALPASNPFFDPLVWEPWKLARKMMVPANPFLQFPRNWWEPQPPPGGYTLDSVRQSYRSPWPLPDFTYTPPRPAPVSPLLDDSRWSLVQAEADRRRSIKDALQGAGIDVDDVKVDWPKSPGQAVPTRFEVEPYRADDCADDGESLPSQASAQVKAGENPVRKPATITDAIESGQGPDGQLLD